MSRSSATVLLLLASANCLSTPAEAARRPVQVDDLLRVRTVADPQVDATGRRVAYTVTRSDQRRDVTETRVWIATADGRSERRLTDWEVDDETSPRWDPQGRRLGFLSNRGTPGRTRLWISDPSGRLDVLSTGAGSVLEFSWSPDGRSVVLVIQDAEEPASKAAQTPSDTSETAAKPWAGDITSTGQSGRPKPIVIDRYRFKADGQGYLTSARKRLWLFDMTTGKMRRLTEGDWDESSVSWAPVGSRIAFVGVRSEEADRTGNYDLWTVDAARPEQAPVRLTSFTGADGDPFFGDVPKWSPDGSMIAFVRGGDPRHVYYGIRRLALVTVDDGSERVLTAALDRNVSSPAWIDRGRRLAFVVEDDGAKRLASVPATGGTIRSLAAGDRVFDAVSSGGGTVAVTTGDPVHPVELARLIGRRVAPLSRQNDEWRAEVDLAVPRRMQFRSSDGTEIHGFIMAPSGASASRAPTLLRIHGGPQLQFDARLNLEWQIFAARGYVVVGANPRGSAGRGEAFGTALFRRWGTLDVQDVLAAIDASVRDGIADPARLGVGGWSYGGILTNYVIAADRRFKAATSGAAMSNMLAGYGTDQYVAQSDVELGRPWTDLQTYLNLSYPFLHADRISTPTLFLGGSSDANVPIAGSEQMYQALRSLDVPTRLIVYPGAIHMFTRPSYLVDRMERYLQWYDEHIGIVR